jgi:hypothetical protein
MLFVIASETPFVSRRDLVRFGYGVSPALSGEACIK